MQETPTIKKIKPQNMPIPTDPASGKFIVADILPPRTPNIRPSAVRPQKKKTIPILPPPKKELPPKKMPLPEKALPHMQHGMEPGSTEALTAWFQKERKTRPMPTPTPFEQPKKRQKKTIVLLLATAGLIILLAGGYGASFLFQRLTVHIELKTLEHSFTQHVAAVTDASEAKTESSILAEVIELTNTATLSFQASGKDTVETKAKGIISIFNAFNTAPQVLVANTRFEASDGRIYRIQQAVTVPAAVMENGTLSPRSIDATVYADKAGPEYNGDIPAFTIPGFKGSPRFAGFYASAKTPMSGGVIGESPIVTQDDIDAAHVALDNEINSRLITKLSSAIPEGFLLLNNAEEITIDELQLSAEAGDAGEAFTGNATARARALIFKKTDLDALLMRLAGIDPATAELRNPDNLVYTVERRSIENGFLEFTIEGAGLFVWKLDTNELGMALTRAGRSEELNAVFQKFEAIDRAEVVFSPSWIRKPPAHANSITITTDFD